MPNPKPSSPNYSSWRSEPVSGSYVPFIEGPHVWICRYKRSAVAGTILFSSDPARSCLFSFLFCAYAASLAMLHLGFKDVGRLFIYVYPIVSCGKRTLFHSYSASRFSWFLERKEGWKSWWQPASINEAYVGDRLTVTSNVDSARGRTLSNTILHILHYCQSAYDSRPYWISSSTLWDCAQCLSASFEVMKLRSTTLQTSSWVHPLSLSQYW